MKKMLSGESTVNFVNVNPPNCCKNNMGVSSSTTVFDGYGEKQLINVIVKDLTIEIVYRRICMFTYTSITSISTGGLASSNPDQIFKEIYGFRDGKMKLLNVIYGKHIPKQYIEESYEFEE